MSQQINLYQAKFRKQRKPLSATEASLGLLVIVVSIIAYAWLLSQRNDRLAGEEQHLSQRLTAQKAVLEKRSAEVTGRVKDVQLDAAATRAEQQVAATRDVMQLINGGAIGLPTGYSEQMRALARQSLHGMWLTGFTLAADPGQNMIRGRTLDAELVPAYLRRLNDERSLAGQRFDSMTISTPGEAAPAPGAAPTADAPRFLEFSVSADPSAAGKVPASKP